jgi:hypothetical protein
MVSFDFGSGNYFSFSGAVSDNTIIGTYTFAELPVIDNGTFRLETAPVLNCANACDNVPVIKFVDTEFTELAKIEAISLFRSGAGHDYSDICENCRSMKHYFTPYSQNRVNGDIKVFSPVDGIITAINPESNGASPSGENRQVHVRSTAHPEYTFILFHIDLLSSDIIEGMSLSKGDQIGYARMYYPDLGETTNNFDIAVRFTNLYGERYVPYFDTITDSLFNNYIARGAVSRGDFIISKGTRDANPLTCSGETFQGPGNLPNWFSLNSPP